ncbi:MAG: hypothetical protein HYY20_04650 [Candidatus Tectomicrobia bacterium]|uniref:Zinc-finger domain-containing protein n=1 Tax=Tectimicrobiota bacterium TaxID=2528274 RepID=A0A932FUZ2_UNCTE|nr:hypothetical protein [Candidatus Tectomicrobia bacterium]
MNRCLRDKALLSLYEGYGTSAQQAHLETCAACAARYQRLAHDLERIGQALREAPPPGIFADRPYPFRLRWAAATAVFALVIALVGGGLWVQRALMPGPATPVALSQEISPFFEEVSIALFSTDDAEVIASPALLAGSVFPEAVPEKANPCSDQDPLDNPGCWEDLRGEEDPFSFLLEGQEEE